MQLLHNTPCVLVHMLVYGDQTVVVSEIMSICVYVILFHIILVGLWSYTEGYWPLECDVCSQIVTSDSEEPAISIFRPCPVSEVYFDGHSVLAVGTPPKTCVSNVPEIECVLLCVSTDAVCTFFVLEYNTRLFIPKMFLQIFTAL
jgi:hypothetical protein